MESIRSSASRHIAHGGGSGDVSLGNVTTLLATAFATGLVATVNPCGFAMLPAYVGFFIGGSEADGGAVGARRALAVSGLMSLGFIAVFGVAGLLISAGVRVIVGLIPWLALVVGIGLVIMGVRTYRGAYLSISLGPDRIDRSSVFRFGVSYGVASLSCTLPIFLSLVAGAFTRATIVEGLAAFVAYAVGMSLAVTAITVGLSFGNDRLVRLMRSSSRYVTRVSGLVLTAAGLFIVWYWAVVLSSGSSALGANSIVRWIDRLSSRITSIVADRPTLVSVALIVVVVTVYLAARHMSDRVGSGETDRVDTRFP